MDVFWPCQISVGEPFVEGEEGRVVVYWLSDRDSRHVRTSHNHQHAAGRTNTQIAKIREGKGLRWKAVDKVMIRALKWDGGFLRIPIYIFWRSCFAGPKTTAETGPSLTQEPGHHSRNSFQKTIKLLCKEVTMTRVHRSFPIHENSLNWKTGE